MEWNHIIVIHYMYGQKLTNRSLENSTVAVLMHNQNAIICLYKKSKYEFIWKCHGENL